jgi:hypothetical protein
MDRSDKSQDTKGYIPFVSLKWQHPRSVLTRRPDLQPRLQLDVEWNLIGFNAVLYDDWTQATLARTKSKDKDLVALES